MTRPQIDRKNFKTKKTFGQAIPKAIK